MGLDEKALEAVSGQGCSGLIESVNATAFAKTNGQVKVEARVAHPHS
jgi:hypothetical protein